MKFSETKIFSDPKTKTGIIGLAWTLTVIVSILSQIPAFAPYLRPVMYLMWMADLAIGFFLSGMRIPKSRFVYLYVAVILFLIAECGICFVLYRSHLDSYMLRVVPLPLICYLVGAFSVEHVNRKVIRIAVITLMASCLFMCIYIYAVYFGSISAWMQSDVYLYTQKNSAGQIIACSVIAGFFILEFEEIWKKVIKYAVLAYLCFILLMLQCRTAIFGMIIAIAAYLIFAPKEKRKYYLILTIVLLVVIAFLISPVSAFFRKAFAIRDEEGDVTQPGTAQALDNYSSGRLTWYKLAWEEFLKTPFIGTGSYRVDNLYLCLLADVGIVGFVPVIALWAVRFFSNVLGFFKKRNAFTTCLVCMTLFYSVESLLEAYPPFGPGVCTFVFWVMSSFLDLKEKMNEEG